MKIETAGFRTLHRPEALVYHEAAKSHNRLTKHELNWFAVTKNTLYCALKNYTGDEPKLRLAARIVIQLIRIRMRPLGELRRGGEINRRSWVRMEWACVRGITAGLFWGMFGEAKPGTIPKAAQAILLYCSGARASPSIGLLSQNLPSESPGGIATYTLTLAESLRDLGCTVHVISAGAYRQDRFDRGIWFHTANPRRIAGIYCGSWCGASDPIKKSRSQQRSATGGARRRCTMGVGSGRVSELGCGGPDDRAGTPATACR